MSDLVDAFRAVSTGRLRVIATLDSLDYEVAFMRDDLAESYSEPDLNRAFRSLMANQVSADDFKRVGPFGDLDCQLLLFERTVVFLFPSSRYDGVFVSYDRDDSVSVLDVVETAEAIPQLSPDGSSSA